MLSTFCKNGLVALIAGLALSVSPANAGTATFTLQTGTVSGTAVNATYSSAAVTGFGSPYDGPYGSGTIKVGLTSSPYQIQIDATSVPLLFNGLLTPISVGSTSGYGGFTFVPPGTPNTYDSAFLSQFHSFSYSNLTFSGSELTGGTFVLSTAPVPEPSALAMGGIALVGLIAARRRFARSAA